jgi:uncharacterized membrane protein YeiH
VISSATVLLVFDLVGVFAFALSGNLLAARRNFDITGGLILGLLAGLGGGAIRDLLLDTTPVALREPIYLLPPVLAAIAVYFAGQRAENARVLIVAFDAMGLALFCTTGTVLAMESGMNFAGSLLMGVVTACGGGLLRDVVANEEPAVFNGSDLYVIPAFVGALLTAVLKQNQLWNAWVGVGIVAFVFAFRMVAWQLQWRVPSPMRGWSFREIDAQLRSKVPVFRGRGKRTDSRDAQAGDE